jgi:hypothetical protein
LHQVPATRICSWHTARTWLRRRDLLRPLRFFRRLRILIQPVQTGGAGWPSRPRRLGILRLPCTLLRCDRNWPRTTHQPTFFGLHLTIRCTKRPRRQFITTIFWNQPPGNSRIRNGKHANVSRCWKNKKPRPCDEEYDYGKPALSCGRSRRRDVRIDPAICGGRTEPAGRGTAWG